MGEIHVPYRTDRSKRSLRVLLVDFERPSSDESVVEARCDALPVARSKILEYASIFPGRFSRSGGPLDTHGSSMARRAGSSSLDLFPRLIECELY